MSDTEDRVKKIVIEHLGVDESKIQSDSTVSYTHLTLPTILLV